MDVELRGGEHEQFIAHAAGTNSILHKNKVLVHATQ